jgi:hypothetical protein
LAEDLEELDVAESASAGLSETSVEGVEHPGQFEPAQDRGELNVAGHRFVSSPNAPGPRSHAGASTGRRVWTGAVSVPAARTPLTVL